MINKKFLKYLIPSITLAAGIAMTIAGFAMGAKSDYINQLNVTSINSEISTSGIAGVNIDISYAELEISASNDTKNIKIDSENVARNYLKYSVSNNVLTLKYSTNKWYEASAIPLLSKKKGKITITVPADKSFQDIQIKSRTGDLSLNYISAGNIYIDCGMGNNSLNTINADYVEINGSTGNITAENISTDEISIYGKSGDICITNLDTKTAVVSDKTGDISLSGKIKGKSRFNGGLGDIKVCIYGKPDDYSIYVPKGKIIVNGEKTTGTSKGKYTMDVSKKMGDIDISFKSLNSKK